MSDISIGLTSTFRAVLSHATSSVGILIAVWSCGSLQAQQPTYLTPVELKGQSLRGSIAVAQHENDGMIGLNGKGTEAGYVVESTVPGGPAASAGILPGDTIVSLDWKSIKGLETSEALAAGRPVPGVPRHWAGNWAAGLRRRG